MWKKSFICLLVSLAVVFSLSAYPAFFYGGAKEAPAVVEEEAETSTEVSEKSTQDLISSKEGSAPEVSDSSENWSDTKSVIELLEENRVKASIIEKVKDACFLIDEGRNEMIVAYNAEVERRNEAENEANRVHYLFVPLASYKPTTQTWGAGLALGIETKNLVLQLQALKPITAGFDSFKDWDDVTILLGAGLRF